MNLIKLIVIYILFSIGVILGIYFTNNYYLSIIDIIPTVLVGYIIIKYFDEDIK